MGMPNLLHLQAKTLMQLVQSWPVATASRCLAESFTLLEEQCTKIKEQIFFKLNETVGVISPK